MMRTASIRAGLGAMLGAVFAAGAARAQDGIEGLEVLGSPVDKALGFQPAATELAVEQQWLDGMLHIVMTGIVVFVCVLLAYVILRFNSRANPKPAKFSHNTPIEIAWTVVPIVILVVLGSFTLPILFKQLRIPVADITIKATGYQWYWGYEYVDEAFAFDSFLLPKEDLAAHGYTDDLHLLATDNAMVIPVGKTIVVNVTATDVIHAWTVPAFAVKQDAVPGRIAQLWFRADREGIYFGQCSELCGKDHSYMPITVKVVSEAVYAEWLTRAKAEFAGIEAPATAVELAAAD